MDEYAQFKTTFFAECVELLADLETRLSALEDGSADDDCKNAIFRAVHSIKAGAGVFSFQALVDFSHKFEALLDKMRDGRVPVTDTSIALLFRATDILADLVSAAEKGVAVSEGYGADAAAALAEMSGASPADHGEDRAASVPAVPEQSRGGPCLSTFRILFEPSSKLFQHANEPLLLLRELQTLGKVEVSIDQSRLPTLSKLDPEDAYFSWTLELTTEAGHSDVEEVFEFVVDDCRIEIELISETAITPDPEAVVEAVVEADVENAAQPAPPAVESKAPATEGDKKLNGGAPKPEATQSATTTTAKVSSIRVDLERIDRLVNMVGELVITQSMLSQQSADLPTDQFPAFNRGLEELAMHTRELQENVMAIRMQPVKSVFTRMPRLVRDLSSKLGKKVKLQTIGEDTEVDKTVIEEISDPITHMIRNSLDHGLEDPAARVAAGKPAEGTILLSAGHRGGRIVITIEDDGAGINRELVLKRARERGLISADASLSDDEIDNLIFAPGFSTAEAVTDVSGRGVGMDVVRRNIQGLGGRIGIRSTPGKGTHFTMTLPLTLAVMDGMIVRIGAEKYVIPITNIIESIRPDADDVHRLPSGHDLVAIRGEYVPLIYLYKAFNIVGATADPAKGLVVLTETEHKGKLGVVVDALLGQQQVVIKSLEINYDPVPGISAATILGNGMVAPILDVDSLRTMADHESTAPLDIKDDEESPDDIPTATPEEALSRQAGVEQAASAGAPEQQA